MSAWGHGPAGLGEYPDWAGDPIPGTIYCWSEVAAAAEEMVSTWMTCSCGACASALCCPTEGRRGWSASGPRPPRAGLGRKQVAPGKGAVSRYSAEGLPA